MAGRVKDQVKSLTKTKLGALLQPQGTAVKLLWLDQGPMTVDRPHLTSELIGEIEQIAEISEPVGKHPSPNL